MKNPFKHIRNWIKGELRRIGCLLEAITRREGIETTKQKAIQRVKDDRNTANKLGSGAFVLAGVFKSASGKASEQQKILAAIAQGEKDILNYDIIKNYLTIYLAEIAIPYFKNHKMKVYLHAMSSFSTEEIENSQRHMETWD